VDGALPGMECIAPFWDSLFRRCEVDTQVALLSVCRRVNAVGMTDRNVIRRIWLVKRAYQLKKFPNQESHNLDRILANDPKDFAFVLNENKTLERCLAVVTVWGHAIVFVPNEKKTREICLAAVRNDGYSLRYIPSEFRSPEIIQAAITKSGAPILRYISPCDRDIAFCELAIQVGNLQSSSFCKSFDLVPRQCRTSELCLLLVKNSGSMIQFLGKDEQTYEVCLAAVSNNPVSLQYIAPENQTPDVCLTAIRIDRRNLEFCHPDLK